jgi:hypothetical protein
LFWCRYTGGLPASLLRNCGDEVGPVRGAQEAGRHALRFVRPRPHAGAYLAGTLAGDVPEHAPESAEALPACLEGDRGDGQAGIAQQRRRALDAPCQQVTMRWQAEGLLEGTCEVGRGDATHPREPLHRPGLLRGGVHAVFRAQQATQQQRRLRDGCTHVWTASEGVGTGRSRAS